MNKQHPQSPDQIVTFDGDTWRVIGRGIANGAGEVFCHLSSTTQFRQQRNGKVPVQIGAFIPAAVLDQNRAN